MSGKSKSDDEAAAELHNRLGKQIVEQTVNEPVAAGGTERALLGAECHPCRLFRLSGRC